MNRGITSVGDDITQGNNDQCINLKTKERKIVINESIKTKQLLT
jgi:hypothetical protein